MSVMVTIKNADDWSFFVVPNGPPTPVPPFYFWFLLACLGAGDPIHQCNGPTVGIMCEPNEMHSLYTYGHWVFLSVSIKRRIRNKRRPRAAAASFCRCRFQYGSFWALSPRWIRVSMDYSKTNVFFPLAAAILSPSAGFKFLLCNR